MSTLKCTKCGTVLLDSDKRIMRSCPHFNIQITYRGKRAEILYIDEEGELIFGVNLPSDLNYAFQRLLTLQKRGELLLEEKEKQISLREFLAENNLNIRVEPGSILKWVASLHSKKREFVHISGSGKSALSAIRNLVVKARGKAFMLDGRKVKIPAGLYIDQDEEEK